MHRQKVAQCHHWADNVIAPTYLDVTANAKGICLRALTASSLDASFETLRSSKELEDHLAPDECLGQTVNF